VGILVKALLGAAFATSPQSFQQSYPQKRRILYKGLTNQGLKNRSGAGGQKAAPSASMTGATGSAGCRQINDRVRFGLSAAVHRRGTRASPCCPRNGAWAIDHCGAQRVHVKQKITLPALAYAQKK
jgi:hypothetical protein